MKTILLILAAALPAFGWCQLPENVSKKEKKQAIKFIRKQLPPHYRKVPMVLKKSASLEIDSMEAKGIRSMIRYYGFRNNNICDSAIVTQICLNGTGIKPKEYIYYTIVKTSDELGIAVISGE